MKIIELSETQFKNYSKMHSSRNYLQTVEYANTITDYDKYFLGFINENDNTLMGATLLLERKVLGFKIGNIPGCFLVDYSNEDLFKDFINTLKNYLKEKGFVYLTTNNDIPYKMFDKNGEVLYYDTNILKVFDELNFKKSSKTIRRKVVLETEKTPDETFKLFNDNTRRNIKLALNRSITIYMDESRDPEYLYKFIKSSDKVFAQKLLDAYNNENNMAEIYYMKINFEQCINNYRYLLKEEEENNEKLNKVLQDVTINKSPSFIDSKMKSDKIITKYNNEIIKASNAYTKYPEEVIIGAILIVKNNREIYFMNEGYDKELVNFYSSHLVKWEIIKKYLNLGYKIFNFGSIKSMSDKDNNYVFKMGFGGKVYEFIGPYDLVVKKFLYYPVKFIDSCKTLINKIKK